MKMTSDVYIEEDRLYGTGIWLYTVYVDRQVYDCMTTSKSLSWSDQLDIVQGYKEALDNYCPDI